jgi:hypothetical protein
MERSWLAKAKRRSELEVMEMRTIILSLVMLSLGCVFSAAAWGQNAISNGSISGIVTDSSGGVVTGASVTVKNEETGVTLNGKTNGSGFYNFASLRVGPYTVTCEPSGVQSGRGNERVGTGWASH